MACLRRICVLAAAALLVISCGRNGRVIPAHKLSKIYAEMLVLDQRIRNNPQLASTADTTLVYEPILNKYGYSGKDYAKSVARYMKDPEAFGKIFKDTREILDSHIKELKAAERARQKADSLRNAIEAKTFLRAPIYMDIACDTVRIDTVAVSIDSLGIYSWRRFVPDTLYDGPVYRLRAKADTVAVADTLAKATETVKVKEVTKPVQVKDAGLQKKLPVPLKTVKLDETSVMMSKGLTRKLLQMRRISAKYLYTNESSQPVENGFVEVDENGNVLRTGVFTDKDAEPEYYDGAVVPGLVNTHCHMELSYLHKKFRKGTGMAGFIDQINEMRDTSSMEKKKADIEFWMKTLWDRGVSAMGDISNCSDSFECKSKSPMYTRTFLEVFGTEPQDCDNVMSGVLELKKVADSFGLDAAPGPHACYTMSPELLTAVSREGLKSGYLSFHSEETQEEEDMMISGSGAMYENRKKAGMSMPPVTGKSSLLYFIDRLEKAHPAPFDEHILLVHECCMNEEGIEAVKKVMRHPFIALCPCSNIFIHNALPPVELMRSSGIKLTVGTDSLSSNDDLDMVKEMFCLQENFPDIPFGELVIWASKNGAEFLGKENELGQIKEGMRPGLVYIDHLSEDGRLTVASASRRII